MNPKGWIHEKQNRFQRFLNKELWDTELEELSFPRSGIYHLLRVIFLLLRGFIKERTMMRAATLTLGTLLTIIPLLAFVFAIAQGLGIQNSLRPVVVGMLIPEGISEIGGPSRPEAPRARPADDDPFRPDAPLKTRDELDKKEAAQAADAAEQRVSQTIATLLDPAAIEGLTDEAINYYTRNTEAKALGGAALLILLLIVIRIMGHVEAAMNEIWGVAQPRSFLRKITDYLSFLILGPLVFAAVTTVNIGIDFDLFVPYGAELQHYAYEFFLKMLPYVIYWLFLSSFYLILPNTKVKVGPALLGGLVAGVILQLLQLFYVRFQVSISSYSEIYGVFAALPIFLIWLNLSWLVILFGAHLTFALQNVRTYEHESHLKDITEADREAIALQLMVDICRRFEEGREPATPSTLAPEFDLPFSLVNRLTYRLEQAGLLRVLETPMGGLAPARPTEQIRVGTVIDVIRGNRTETQTPAIERVMTKVNEAMAEVSQRLSLHDLVRETAAPQEEKTAVLRQPAAGQLPET